MNPPSTTAMPLAVTIEAVTGSDPCVPRTAGHPRLRVLGRADPGRPLAREMIRDAYRQVYGADVEPTCPWLVALGQDVEIVVKPHQGRRDNATLDVS